jgi:hypothetical protein
VDAAKPRQKKEDRPMEDQPFQDETPRGEDAEKGSNEPRPISEKKLAANQRNAQKSTGPTTDEGKKSSSMNALRHGLLARETVIRLGDYQEDFTEYLELLDDLWKRLQPVGHVEELEVEIIAKCYWIEVRETRSTNAVIRRRTLGMRKREEGRRAEAFADVLAHCPVRALLEETAHGLEHVIDVMEAVKAGLQTGGKAAEMKKSITWLIAQYPDDFAPGPDMQPADLTAGGIPAIRMTAAYVSQVRAAIDQQLARLIPLRVEVARLEEMQLEAKIDAAAFPVRHLERTGRYMTTNDRKLERRLEQLDAMQARRKASGRISWPMKAS